MLSKTRPNTVPPSDDDESVSDESSSDNIPTITFVDDANVLRKKLQKDFKINQKIKAEIYTNEPTPIFLVSNEDPNLQNILDSYVDGKPIGFSIQMGQSSGNQKKNIALFQFCSSKGVLLVKRMFNNPPNPSLHIFLKSHHFFSKSGPDLFENLGYIFGSSVVDFDIEDISRTRLLANQETDEFKPMLKKYSGFSVLASSFSNTKKMSYSKWDNRDLNLEQVLYAAFRILAIFKCVQNMPPAKLDFISLHHQTLTPIDVIPGIERFPIKKGRKYMVVMGFDPNDKSPEKKIMDLVGNKENFCDISMYGDKAIIEINNDNGISKRLSDNGLKVGFLDVHKWLNYDS